MSTAEFADEGRIVSLLDGLIEVDSKSAVCPARLVEVPPGHLEMLLDVVTRTSLGAVEVISRDPAEVMGSKGFVDALVEVLS